MNIWNIRSIQSPNPSLEPIEIHILSSSMKSWIISTPASTSAQIYDATEEILCFKYFLNTYFILLAKCCWQILWFN